MSGQPVNPKTDGLLETHFREYIPGEIDPMKGKKIRRVHIDEN